MQLKTRTQVRRQKKTEILRRARGRRNSVRRRSAKRGRRRGGNEQKRMGRYLLSCRWTVTMGKLRMNHSRAQMEHRLSLYRILQCSRSRTLPDRIDRPRIRRGYTED